MQRLRRILFKLRVLASRRTREADLDAELQFHLGEEAEEARADGLSAIEARQAARRRLGNLALIKEHTRDMWRWLWLEQLGQDLRYAARVLRRNWRLASVIVLTIAVSIGASSAILSVASPVLMRPLPFEDADRLFRIRPSNAEGQPVWISLPVMTEWQGRLGGARLAGYSVFDFSVFGGHQGPESILAARVTDHLFDVLGTQMTLGRLFDADDHRPGGSRSVILSYAFWQRRYGSDPSIIGRTIELAGPAFMSDSAGHYRVVGVLAPEFWLFAPRLEIFVPLRLSAEQLSNRQRATIETVLAKFEPGVPESLASTRINDVIRDLAADYGLSEPTARASTTPAQAAHFEEFGLGLRLAVVSVLLLFALAAGNVAAMMLAFTVSRRKEFALRAAFGVSRFGLFRQALTEGLVLGGVGGVTGILFGWAGTLTLRMVVPGSLIGRIPGQAEAITLDAHVTLVTIGAILLISLVCGLTVFLATGGVRLETTVREATRGTTSAPKYTRLRTAILGAQLTLAVALVVTTSVLSVSLLQLQSVPLGLNTERLVSFWLNLDAQRYPSAPERMDFYDRVMERLASTSDVELVSGIDLPSNLNWQKTPITANAVDSGISELPDVFARAVTPNYFPMVGMSLVEGRGFAVSDGAGTLPVAVVSRSLADRLWPNGGAVGQRVRAGHADSSEPWLTVVGVVSDVRRVPHEPPTLTLYRPVRQQTPEWLYLMVRGRPQPVDLAANVRQAVWADDPRQPVEGPYVISEWVREMTGLLRFIVLIGLTFSGFSILLAFTGVYGLTADLSQRAMREIGIRKTLGASTGEILRMHLVRSARSAIPALLLGGIGGTALVRTMASSFEGVGSARLGTTMFVIVVFGALVALATCLASRRAAGVDPASAIRAG